MLPTTTGPPSTSGPPSGSNICTLEDGAMYQVDKPGTRFEYYFFLLFIYFGNKPSLYACPHQTRPVRGAPWLCRGPILNDMCRLHNRYASLHNMRRTMRTIKCLKFNLILHKEAFAVTSVRSRLGFPAHITAQDMRRWFQTKAWPHCRSSTDQFFDFPTRSNMMVCLQVYILLTM